jgi:hypothetical protein
VSFEEYYLDPVREILDSVVNTLYENPAIKFNWAEVAFLQRWYDDPQTKSPQRTRLHQIIENGQFQFVSGSWVQADEALVSFEETLEQSIQGLQWLKTTFGAHVLPKSYWQLDPFGYSSKTPTLLSELGFDSMVLVRISSFMKDHLAKEGELAFLWQGHEQSGE